jgi:hypothetical protein
VTQWKLFEGDVPYVSTPDYHRDRDRAPHLEQAGHRPRLEKAAEFVERALDGHPHWTLSDLGCGDGGLLSLAQRPGRVTWGYDFCPANAAGWAERGVEAYALDVFGADIQRVRLGDVVAMTEVLEHLEDPHGVLRWTRQAQALVCSSPWNENDRHHSPEHAWAWDTAGYADMISGAGWVIIYHEQVGGFQVVLAV